MTFYWDNLCRHAGRFGEVYAACGKLFSELDQFKEKFKIWIAPGLIDLDNFFEHVLVEPKDWDVAFQAAKKKKEELSNLLRSVRSLFYLIFWPHNFLIFQKITTVTMSVLDALSSALVLCIERSSTFNAVTGMR